MAGLIIKPRARIFHGHDWVYSSEVQKTFGDPLPGEVITLKDFRDRPLGTAIYNPNSQIVARRISRRKQKLELEFFKRRIKQAIDLRESSGIDLSLSRLVWSESDALPGVIVDRYGDHVILQTLTLAMYLNVDFIKQALIELLEPKSIILRNDSVMLKVEGIPEEVKVIYGEKPESFTVEANDVLFEVDLIDGQKTGLYLDQLEAHKAIQKYVKGKRVLDVFCNQGGFALAAAKAGAAEVTAIDISESAIESTKRNAELNGLNINAIATNAFHYLKNCEEQYDVVILDPPSFTRNKKTLNDAMRGYKEIHLRGLKLLEKDGHLSTFCCSHHASRELFLSNVVSASVDAKKSLRLVEQHHQRADHPILPAIPETEYLKGFTFQLTPSR